MNWPTHYKVRVQSYLVTLMDLNQLACNHEFRQLFQSSPKRLNPRRIKFLIAMKLAADDMRKRKRSVPADAVALLTLMKERDRV